MNAVGIIAEYNPFHNGHFHHIAEAKKISGAKWAVVVMSGDFVQRGEPAVLDKYARCEMALSCGADLVIELPVCFSTGSAEYFAGGAVCILNALGIPALCFGSECGKIAPLDTVARVLTDEPDDYKSVLNAALKKGNSFPAARALALDACLPGGYAALLESPNNILGVEYLKALRRTGSPAKAFTVPRDDAGYLDTALPEDSGYCSALALRNLLYAGDNTEKLAPYMPSRALEILKRSLDVRTPLCADDFSAVLFYKLLSEQQGGYEQYSDVNASLSDKITNGLEHFSSFSQFSGEVLKSRDLTQTRVNRCLLHILLGIRGEDVIACSALGNAPYARVLGFRKEASRLLGELEQHADIPLITRLSEARSTLSPEAFNCLEKDLYASHLYSGIFAQKNGGTMQHEYRRKIIVL